ncbi:hypothetical protein J31TS4_44680 [Paenibacillus sp. J31TS4]|uniref:MsnO8 family LLM class oxidoreductase n=1 Tax=Paenibacillus sp. J31TS4 TaxID=2807195 RepID=UPI001B1D86A9|nr:MsnO8 family LLM class oxidoreductase [Paenibacillus sp. J31TS4]GIP41188.1 hypothetical protein J31TS4_44680 [Paenibacillus sp. J31TS4]
MKLSVLDLVPQLEGANPQEALENAVLLAQTAERLGYTRYWVPEHHDMEHLASAAPEVLLAHIGARTSRIRLGSGAVLLPHYKPIKVAEAFHLLAALYPGRIDLGLGRAPGGSAHVTMALSGNFLANVRKMPELVADVQALLENEYRLDGVRVTARPLPPEPPELWLLGTNDKSAVLAARTGTGYAFGQFMSDRDGTEVLAAYRSAFVPSGRRREPETIVAVGVVCAETEEEALRLAAGVAGRTGPPDADRQPSAAEEPPLRDRLLAGTAAQIRERLLRLGEEYGTDEWMVVTAIQDYAKRLRSYELLGEAIL